MQSQIKFFIYMDYNILAVTNVNLIQYIDYFCIIIIITPKQNNLILYLSSLILYYKI